MRSLRDAELAWNETSYLKAEGLCLLAIQYAGEAARLAAQRANVEQECRVTALQGSAEVMYKAEGHWEPIQEGAKVSVSSTLKTDAGSRAELTMPEGSKVQIGERSEVQIDGLLKDLRTDRMRIRLRLRLGEILNRVQPLRTKDSIFEIKSGESATAVRGTELRVKQEARGTSLIMTVAGEAITSTKRWAKAVRENFGILVDKKQRSRGPVKLLPPPTVQSPTPERFVTAAQTLNFRWDPVGGRVIVWFFKRPRTSYRLSGVTQYHLEIARDAAFNYVVESDHTADTHLTSKVLSPGDYYWRISSIDANRLEGKWSQSGQFCIRRDLVVNVATDVEPVEIGGRKLVRTGVAVPATPVNTNTSVVQLEYSINGQPFRVFDKTPVLREAGETSHPDARSG